MHGACRVSDSHDFGPMSMGIDLNYGYHGSDCSWVEKKPIKPTDRGPSLVFFFSRRGEMDWA